MSIFIGALTTTFTPPVDCNWFSVEFDESTIFEVDKYNLFWPSVARCFPSGFPTGYVVGGDYFYSPGICLSGWSAYPDPATTGAETRVSCCPPDFTLGTGVYESSGCVLVITAPTTVTAAVLVGTDFTTYRTGPSAGSPVTIATSTDYVVPPNTFVVDAFHVRYKEGDFPSVSQASQTSQTTSSASSSASAVSPGNNSNTELSSGAKIGIGVSIPLVVILLAIAGFFIHQRRRRGLKGGATSINDETLDYGIGHKPELPGNGHGQFNGAKSSGKPELDTVTTQINPAVELAQSHSSQDRPELNGQTRSSEQIIPDAELSPHSSQHQTELDGQARPSELDNSSYAIPELENSTAHTRVSELETNPIKQGADASVSIAVTTSTEGQSQGAGLFPLPSELFSSVNMPEEDLDEEELRYQEQRLRERRDLIAEKEKLAIEEDRLRRIRAKKGEPSRLGP